MTLSGLWLFIHASQRQLSDPSDPHASRYQPQPSHQCPFPTYLIFTNHVIQVAVPRWLSHSTSTITWHCGDDHGATYTTCNKLTALSCIRDKTDSLLIEDLKVHRPHGVVSRSPISSCLHCNRASCRSNHRRLHRFRLRRESGLA